MSGEQMAKEDPGTSKPPYVPFDKFEKALHLLARTGLPANLRAYDLKMSASFVAQLLPAFRYLQLCDGTSQPTAELGDLVACIGTDEYPGKLRALLESRYPDLAGLDLAVATPSDFARAMTARSVSPDVSRKAIRFYLRAAERAGYELGPRLRFGRRTPAPSRSRSRLPSSRAADPHTVVFRQQMMKELPAFDPSWSDRVKVAWLGVYERIAEGL
jgi:hypothetical protein